MNKGKKGRSKKIEKKTDKGEKNLYRFDCTPRRDRFRTWHTNWDEDPEYNLPDLKCESCEDKICYFLSTPTSWYEDLCKLLVWKLKTKGKVTLEEGSGKYLRIYRIPHSFHCLGDSIRITDDESDLDLDGNDANKEQLLDFLLKCADAELCSDIKACVTDLGAVNPEIIQALLTRHKTYSQISREYEEFEEGEDEDDED